MHAHLNPLSLEGQRCALDSQPREIEFYRVTSGALAPCNFMHTSLECEVERRLPKEYTVYVGQQTGDTRERVGI